MTRDEARAALRHAAAGAWDEAHAIVQSHDGPDAAWIHAHLHRVEGDLDNAAYWYGRAGRPVSTGPLDAERADIGAALA